MKKTILAAICATAIGAGSGTYTASARNVTVQAQFSDIFNEFATRIGAGENITVSHTATQDTQGIMQLDATAPSGHFVIDAVAVSKDSDIANRGAEVTQAAGTNVKQQTAIGFGAAFSATAVYDVDVPRL